eukprot:symbB.v1.2.007070.t1/scaffold414.1/size398445/34
MRWKWAVQNLFGGLQRIAGAQALVKQGGGGRCGASRLDFEHLLSRFPVLVYQGVVDGETCRRATQLLEASGNSGSHLFEEWRLGRDPDAPASDYTKIGYTKTDVLIQQGFRMTATSAAPEAYLDNASKTAEYLHKVFAGQFILDLLTKELAPLGIHLRLEKCPRSQRPFLPCVVRRMEAGGRRKEGNVHMDTVLPHSTLSLNLYLNVPEMSGGELVLYPVRKTSLQRFLNSHFFETIDLQNFYPNHDFYTKDMLEDIEPIVYRPSAGDVVLIDLASTPAIMGAMEEQLKALESRVAALEAWQYSTSKLHLRQAPGDDTGMLPGRKQGSDAQVMKKVATRLQDFESQITAQLSNLQTDFDKKLSHVNRGAATSKGIDGTSGAAGLDTMAEDLDQLKYDVGELKDLLGNNKGEVNHIRRIVLACERDMEDFTAAMDAVNVDLDEMRARVDATHSIITSRQRVEATMTAEISTMRLDIGDIQEALKNHDSWMEDVSNTLQQMQEKEENLTEDIINLKNEMCTKLDTKVDNVAWKEANDDLDAAIKTVRDMVSSLRLDVDARRRKVDEILATVRHDITAVETNLEESKAKITSDTDQAVNALNGRIDFTNKDLAATQESLHTTQNSLSDCFNEVAVVRSDLERNVADTEARLKNDIRQKQQEAFEKIGAVEQQAELRSAEASRRLGALDLRMSGVQGGPRKKLVDLPKKKSGLGEHKRDILKLREEVNGLTVKSASHEVDIQKNGDAVRKMEKQRNMDEQNWKVFGVDSGCPDCRSASAWRVAVYLAQASGLCLLPNVEAFLLHVPRLRGIIKHSQPAFEQREAIKSAECGWPNDDQAASRELFKSTSLPNLDKDPMRQRPVTADGVRSFTNDPSWSRSGSRPTSAARELFTAQATSFKRRPNPVSGENTKGSYSLMCWRETTDDIRTFPYRGLKGSLAPPAFARSLMMPEMRKAGVVFT